MVNESNYLNNKYELINKIYESNYNMYNNHYIKYEKEIDFVQYSKGGDNIYDGWYCPSPVFDIIVTNVNRGKLLKKITEKTRFSYQYGFNKNKELIQIIHYPESCREFIIKDKLSEVRIAYDKQHELRKICYCEYNSLNNIVNYNYAYIYGKFPNNRLSMQLHSEIYRYTGNYINECTIHNIMPPMPPALCMDFNINKSTTTHYYFANNNGKLTISNYDN
jgi:hypothetical protein